MAPDTDTAASDTAQSNSESGSAHGRTVSYRRPNRDHAIELAREQFLAGERVEMGSLAEALDIGRTTLYRWVGERDQLLNEVFGGLVDEWFALVEPQARGRGRARTVDIIRRFLEYAAASPPLTSFAEREPALILRLLLDREGQTVERSKLAVRRILDENEPGLEVPDKFIEAIDLTSAGLVWANIAIGRDPDIDGAVNLAETLLDSCKNSRS